MNNKIKVFIVDDHQIVIDGISSIFEFNEQVEVVGHALSGQEALDQLSNLEIDVLLLDINMPEMDGIEVAGQLKEQGFEGQILVLTMHNEPHFTKQLIELGVRGCLMKNAGKKEMLHAIQTVYQGKRYYSSEVTNTLFDSIDKSQKAVEQAELTKREVEVLKLIAQEYNTKEIADKLFISTHTVETHRKNLLSKLAVKNSAGLARYAAKNHLDE